MAEHKDFGGASRSSEHSSGTRTQYSTASDRTNVEGGPNPDDLRFAEIGIDPDRYRTASEKAAIVSTQRSSIWL